MRVFVLLLCLLGASAFSSKINTDHLKRKAYETKARVEANHDKKQYYTYMASYYKYRSSKTSSGKNLKYYYINLAKAFNNLYDASKQTFESQLAIYHRARADGYAMVASSYRVAKDCSSSWCFAKTKFKSDGDKAKSWASSNKSASLLEDGSEVVGWQGNVVTAESLIADLDGVDEIGMLGETDLSTITFDCASIAANASQQLKLYKSRSDVWLKFSHHALAGFYTWSYQNCKSTNTEKYARGVKSLMYSVGYMKMSEIFASGQSTCKRKAAAWDVLVNRWTGNSQYWHFMYLFDKKKYDKAQKWADGWKKSAASALSSSGSACPSPATEDTDGLSDLVVGRRRALATPGFDGVVVAAPLEAGEIAASPMELLSVCNIFNGNVKKACNAIADLIDKLDLSISLSKIRDAARKLNPCNILTSTTKTSCNAIFSMIKKTANWVWSTLVKMVETAVKIAKALITLGVAMVTAYVMFLQQMAAALNQYQVASTSYLAPYCNSIYNDVAKILGAGDCCSQAVISGVALVNDVGWIGYGYPPSVAGAIDSAQCMSYAQAQCSIGNDDFC